MDGGAVGAQLRPMRAGDIAGAVALTQAEGWPHGLSDWAFHLSHGSGWALESADEELLGTLIWWEFGEDFAMLGLIVVDRRFQGCGLGTRLMQHAVAALAGRTLRLVATEAGYSLYQRHGFHPVAPVQQRQAVLKEVAALAPGPNEVLRPLLASDLEDVCRLDRDAIAMDRRALLRDVCSEGEGLALEQSGTFAGFAVMRRAGRGQVVGPLVAQNEDQARLLLSHLLAGCEDFCRIDVPGDPGELAGWLDEIGLPVVDEVTAMRAGTGPMSEGRVFHAFALVSQALG